MTRHSMTTELMPADGIADQVRDIIARQAVVPIDDVGPDVSLQALGLDSMALVETIFAIEETFDITVPFNANETDTAGLRLDTVQDVIDAVTDLLAHGNG
ncbi:acyl carrier protein [Albidovulum inexpectatum]|uniref:Acyl carrier protein n=1 Tax=Albidovulum inexpectatum TaxID=196587 RepID=A0A2S5JK79_9RHOB|nr:acyl carrier protein [Albidovulum inexpectatum]PPB81879.1 acyl carrier protein [Albidovulum inexpectatum]